MKKFLIAFEILFLISMLSCVAFASTTEDSGCKIDTINTNSSDYSNIVNLEDDIRDIIDDMYLQSQGALPGEYKIDFSSAEKIYICEDLFTECDDKEVEKKIKESEYIWNLMVYVNGNTYQVQIAKGEKLNTESRSVLTDDEIAVIEDSIGKWSVSAVYEVEHEIKNYDNIITEEIGDQYDEDFEVLVCGGLQAIEYPAAIIVDGERAEYLIPLDELKIDGTRDEIMSLKPDFAKSGDNIYYYDEIRKAAREMEVFEETGGAGYILLSQPSNATKLNFILGISFISLSLLFFLFILKVS